MDSGFSVLADSAVMMHEIYVELRKAGFTQDEALSLVAKIARGEA